MAYHWVRVGRCGVVLSVYSRLCCYHVSSPPSQNLGCLLCAGLLLDQWMELLKWLKAKKRHRGRCQHDTLETQKGSSMLAKTSWNATWKSFTGLTSLHLLQKWHLGTTELVKQIKSPTIKSEHKASTSKLYRVEIQNWLQQAVLWSHTWHSTGVTHSCK